MQQNTVRQLENKSKTKKLRFQIAWIFNLIVLDTIVICVLAALKKLNSKDFKTIIAGAVGQWEFRTSEYYCEANNYNPAYLCINWYYQQQYSLWYSPYYWWYVSYYYQPCPCFYWQAIWDYRFYFDWYSYCAYSSFYFWSFGQVGWLITLFKYKFRFVSTVS